MNRRGSSLLFVLIALALLGALAGLLFGFLRVSRQGGEGALRAMQVRLAAEGEVERVTAQWDPRIDSLTIGGSFAVLTTGSPGGLRLVDSILRLSPWLYLVRVVAERRAADGALLARYGSERLGRVYRPQVPDSQAVLAVGPLVTEGSPVVSGEDLVPQGWDSVCPTASGTGTGVKSGSSPPTAGACDTCILGHPAAVTDTSLRGGFLDRIAGVPLADMARVAEHQVGGTVSGIGPVEAGGVCDGSAPLNWGDPGPSGTPCGTYFPLVVAQPGTRVEGGVGQGFLLGLGSLELAGNFGFNGVVFARGAVTLLDQARVAGAVLAEDTVRVVGAARIDRSRCAVSRAVNGVVWPLDGLIRSWSRGP